MSGDASTPEQDQTVESGAVPATPESAPDAPEATSEQAPAAVDPADRMQQLEQELSALKQEHETLKNELLRIPGVESVTFSSQVPYEQSNSSSGVVVIRGLLL